jgi:hypothetical protein
MLLLADNYADDTPLISNYNQKWINKVDAFGSKFWLNTPTFAYNLEWRKYNCNWQLTLWNSLPSDY